MPAIFVRLSERAAAESRKCCPMKDSGERGVAEHYRRVQ
jgi:hypothetical protein